MSFQPLIPLAGISGWSFLKRTHDDQLRIHRSLDPVRSDSVYFEKTAPGISNVHDLVSDRRLLKTVLTAFGLQDDLKNVYFIRKILEDGTTANDALANRLADKRYREMSLALGFGPDQGLKITRPSVIRDIIDQSAIRSFELAVGEQDENMRLALNARRSFPELAVSESGNDAGWYALMADPPLRKVLEAALSLPASFGQIDLDQQLRIFKDRSNSMLGTSRLRDFGDPELVERIISGFLAREQISRGAADTSGAGAALAMLQAARI